MKNKIKKIQIFRIISQIAFLILLPGLFTLTFSELKKLYQMVIQGNFNIYQALAGSAAFISVIILTVLFGRFFCGWMCAFGTFNDFIHIISKNVFKIDIKVDEKVDAALKYVKYVILIIIIAIAWTMGSNIFQGTSPWDAFAQITNFPQVLYDYAFGVAILLLIAIGAMFIERFFCRYLCPLGAVFAIISKLSLFKIKKPNEKCGKCRLCTNNCSMGLPLYKKNAVRGGECINCLKCVETCPRKNTNAAIVNEDVNPALASSIAVATFVGLYSVNNIGASMINNSTLTSISNAVLQNKYKDGTYTGTADGFRPNMQLSVTIKNNKITNISVISTNDSQGYFDQAFNTVSNEIIKAQSTAVDTVSGATYSSNGIINAVKNALQNAASGSTTSSSSSGTSNSAANSSQTQNSSSTENTTGGTSESNNANNTEAASNSGSNTNASTNTSTGTSTTNSSGSSSASSSTSATAYKDGTYTGTANGYRPGLTVSVTVKSNKITNIEITQINDTPRFYQRPISVIPDEIIQKQSADVDTVSGATYTSEGIINAVKAALAQAKA